MLLDSAIGFIAAVATLRDRPSIEWAGAARHRFGLI
jgi:hypothetical protein